MRDIQKILNEASDIPKKFFIEAYPVIPTDYFKSDVEVKYVDTTPVKIQELYNYLIEKVKDINIEVKREEIYIKIIRSSPNYKQITVKVNIKLKVLSNNEEVFLTTISMRGDGYSTQLYSKTIEGVYNELKKKNIIYKIEHGLML